MERRNRNADIILWIAFVVLGCLVLAIPSKGQIGICTQNPTKRSEAGTELTATQYDNHVTATRDVCQATIATWPTSSVKLDMGSGTFEVPNSTTLPATCVVGEVYSDTDASPVSLQLYLCTATNTWTAVGSTRLEDGDGDTFVDVEETADADEVVISTAGVDRVTIQNDGDVGVGIGTPARPLHISDVMRMEPRASAPTSPSEGDVYVDDSGALCVYLNTSWVAAAVDGAGACS